MNRDVVWIKAKCDNYYKLLEKLQFIRVKVFDIKYNKGIIHLKVLASDAKKIDKYLVSYKFVLEENTGLKKILDIIKKEYIFLIALVIGFCLFLVVNKLILKIEIVHENRALRELIADELDNCGIKVLSFKKSYKELEKIKNNILDKYPTKIDWMEFEVKGMVLRVRVEERIITDTSVKEKLCNVVASKSGMISDVIVFDGVASVLKNDYVRKGDILISGTVKYNEEAKRYVCASGEVYATTWYTVKVSIPFKTKENIRTGHKKYNLVYETKNKKEEILRKRFDKYESKLRRILKVFDFNLYLEEEWEVKEITKKLSEKEALNLGLEKASNTILKKIGENSTIIDKKVLKNSLNNSKMDIDVFIVAKELISTEEEFSVLEGN